MRGGEFAQLERLEDIRLRPDLAVTLREVTVGPGTIGGVVHNIGGGDAPAFSIALMDADGKILEERQLDPLPAPSDLKPKRGRLPV